MRARRARLWNSPSRVYRRGRAIVLMPGPHDNFCRKVNGINTYDVFGYHRIENGCFV
jgi:hypothetical protein